MALTYKKAGVDISKIKQSQREIGKLIASTHNLQKKAKMTHGFGHYAGIVEIPGGKLLATHTDGVGTKVVIANMMKKYEGQLQMITSALQNSDGDALIKIFERAKQARDKFNNQ